MRRCFCGLLAVGLFLGMAAQGHGQPTYTLTTDPDSGVVLPADYTFTTGDSCDNGVHTFTGGLTLATAGDQTLTAIDTVSGITGRVTITVGPRP